VQWLRTADGLRRDAVRAMVTADGTHAQWLCLFVNTWRPYMQRLQQMGCIETHLCFGAQEIGGAYLPISRAMYVNPRCVLSSQNRHPEKKIHVADHNK